MRPELFIQQFPPEIESSLLPATQKGLLKEGSNPSFEALLLVGLLFKQMSAFYSFYISVDVLASTGFLPFFFWVGKHTWSFITISCFLGYLLLNNQFLNREGIVLPFRAAMPQRARVLEFKDSSSMFLTILPVTSIL